MRPSRCLHLIALFCLLMLCASGCKDEAKADKKSESGKENSGEPGGDEPAAGDKKGFDGLYQVESHTNNPDGCDAEGASTDNAASFLAIHFSDQYRDAWNAVGCGDLESCEKIRQDPSASVSSVFYWQFTEMQSSTALKGSSYSAGGGNGQCHGSVSTLTAVLTEDGDLTIENRTVEVPPWESETCMPPGDEAAEGQPCTELTVIKAKRKD